MPYRQLYALLSAGLLLFACRPESTTTGTDWPLYSSDAAGSKYSELDQINVGNVDQLQPAWIYRTDDQGGRTNSTIECNPIIVDGIMYLTTPSLKVIALEAATGTERWRFDPFAGKRASGVNRGVTYWSNDNEKRIYFVASANLYAIDAETGTLVTDFGRDGIVDLHEGLGRDVRTTWVTAATPGIIYNDLLILGSTLGEGPAAAAPGHIRAYDLQTGAMRWIFHTIPYPEEFGYDTWSEDSWQHIGGANAWGGFTLDQERGMVFCGTGSAAYDHWGGNRLGENLFANCILALDAATGERIWHYQVVHHDIWDYDIPCPPNLVQVEKDGRLIDAVAQPTKMGHLFVLDRQTGEPIFPVEEVPVPVSDIPGEVSWPTQPFPPVGLRYTEQRFTHDNVTRRTPEATAFVRARLDSMDTGDIFLPPSERGAVTLPQFNGGTDWGGAAYDPHQRELYVNASNEAEWISMVRAEPPAEITRHQLGRNLYGSICSACHGFGDPKTPDSPSLQQIARDRSKAEIHQVLLNGKGSMPKFAALSEDERAALVAFLKDEGHEEKLATADLELSFAQEIPYTATGHREFKDPDGFPVNAPPWGTLSAIDLDAGQVRWQIPLGTYPELEAQGLPPTGTFNMGGPVITAGGLIFIGAAMDERFRAIDRETGEVLWQYQMDAGGYATPATYAVDGKQYVVIAAGGGGKPGTKAGNAYYCFALP
ncbi:outer membrane protein assembly factor BamB family protein [Flavilitoribacter nigricans]|uniref:Pyrrolo-quinoline quinone n=1 Tax=Flavilitoribacter nigricans (strain ATCC 23147 / DSM 23189 / NBRC 102662 / NCIMB 1420 / SS-2) TaxID=1122177 RepID=A0A2D0NIA9_FLAN2|nr:PQQ-binding-like beta-propeller repeat protein [Flavilitoribacter nigricans]PHN08187.1 pyrrolo-quinoline quinone [Flavilitoribacter nigricans DSM 23189 = NBRC 102662]